MASLLVTIKEIYCHIWITAEWPGTVFAKGRAGQCVFVEKGGHTLVGVDRRWDGGEGGGDKGQCSACVSDQSDTKERCRWRNQLNLSIPATISPLHCSWIRNIYSKHSRSDLLSTFQLRETSGNVLKSQKGRITWPPWHYTRNSKYKTITMRDIKTQLEKNKVTTARFKDNYKTQSHNYEVKL